MKKIVIRKAEPLKTTAALYSCYTCERTCPPHNFLEMIAALLA